MESSVVRWVVELHAFLASLLDPLLCSTTKGNDQVPPVLQNLGRCRDLLVISRVHPSQSVFGDACEMKLMVDVQRRIPKRAKRCVVELRIVWSIRRRAVANQQNFRTRNFRAMFCQCKKIPLPKITRSIIACRISASRPLNLFSDIS